MQQSEKESWNKFLKFLSSRFTFRCLPIPCTCEPTAQATFVANVERYSPAHGCWKDTCGPTRGRNRTAVQSVKSLSLTSRTLELTCRLMQQQKWENDFQLSTKRIDLRLKLIGWQAKGQDVPPPKLYVPISWAFSKYLETNKWYYQRKCGYWTRCIQHVISCQEQLNKRFCLSLRNWLVKGLWFSRIHINLEQRKKRVTVSTIDQSYEETWHVRRGH